MIGRGGSVRLAVAADGSAIAVFETGSGDEHKTLWASHFDPVSGWVEAAPIFEVDTGGRFAVAPLLVQLGGNAAGHAVALVEFPTDSFARSGTSRRWVGGPRR